MAATAAQLKADIAKLQAQQAGMMKLRGGNLGVTQQISALGQQIVALQKQLAALPPASTVAKPPAKGIATTAPAVKPAAPTIVPVAKATAAAAAVTPGKPAVAVDSNSIVVSRPQLVRYDATRVVRIPKGGIRTKGFVDVVYLDDPQESAADHIKLTYLDDTGTHTKDIPKGGLKPYGFTISKEVVPPAAPASTASIVADPGASQPSGGGGLLDLIGSILTPTPAPAPAPSAGLLAAAPAPGGDVAPVTGPGPVTPAGSQSGASLASLLKNPYAIAGGVGVVSVGGLIVLKLLFSRGGK